MAHLVLELQFGDLCKIFHPSGPEFNWCSCVKYLQSNPINKLSTYITEKMFQLILNWEKLEFKETNSIINFSKM